jgi:hypothetical protein
MDKENDLSSRLESQREINAQKMYAVSVLEGRTASLARRGGCCSPFGPIHATYLPAPADCGTAELVRRRLFNGQLRDGAGTSTRRCSRRKGGTCRCS